jgi:hypothetical protein
MVWANIWLTAWGLFQAAGIYPSLSCAWFRWIVAQTGFAYMPTFDELDQ